MPKSTVIECIIAKIYRRKYEDIGMFFFVNGIRSVVPSVSITQAIYLYYEFIKFEDYNIESAKTIFSRMQSEFIDLNYENTTKNKGDIGHKG